MTRELPHYDIGASYGGNQEWFDGFMMRLGGCAAETAIECCIYFDRYKDTHLCPFDAAHISKADFVSFGEVMRPYLHPRMSGVDRLSIYLDGFGQYLRDKGSYLTLTGLEGTEPYERAKTALIAQIECGVPVPFLCLYHSNPRFKDYEWHWFLLNGYTLFENTLMVKAVTYGSFEWLPFEPLWNTGRARKGGMILIK